MKHITNLKYTSAWERPKYSKNPNLIKPVWCNPHTLYLRHHHKHFHFCFLTVFSNSLPLEKILIFLTSCTKSSSVGSQRPNCPPTSGHYSSYNRRHLAWSFTRGRGQLFWVRSPTTIFTENLPRTCRSLFGICQVTKFFR